MRYISLLTFLAFPAYSCHDLELIKATLHFSCCQVASCVCVCVCWPAVDFTSFGCCCHSCTVARYLALFQCATYKCVAYISDKIYASNQLRRHMRCFTFTLSLSLALCPLLLCKVQQVYLCVCVDCICIRLGLLLFLCGICVKYTTQIKGHKAGRLYKAQSHTAQHRDRDRYRERESDRDKARERERDR